MSYSYEIGVAAITAGTVAIAGTASVTGTATSFLSQFQVGDYITVAGENRIVDSVTNDNLLAVTIAFAGTATGQYAYRVRMANVENLGLPAPRGIFTPYSMPLDLGDGSLRGAGWKMAEWRWGFLTRAQRDILRVYCTGASSAVYIKTRTVDSSDAYALYSAKMIWPQQEEPQAGRRLEFTVRFRALVAFP